MTNDTSKVLTLVFTDLVGSTGLKAEHGDHAVGELIARHRELVVRLAEESAGRIIDWAGDGCFLTFETSSAGVMFALRLQQAHAEDPKLPGVRVGLHMGEITEKIGPAGPGGPPLIEGLAVDLASRIEGLARPGQVLMSSAVYQSARQRLGVDALGKPILWQAYGDYSVKGLDDPLDICEAGLEGLSPLEPPEASEKAQPLVPMIAPETAGDKALETTRAARYVLIGLFFMAVIAITLGTDFIAGKWRGSSSAPPDESGAIRSLAVLPLANLTNDPDQDYFADGMTEAIIAELARIKALSVTSRTSVMRYKDTQLSLPAIAAELGVEGLVEGSVVRDGAEVSISVKLIDGRTDETVLSDTYTDTVTSVLRLQAKVALEIAGKIRGTITPEEQQQYATRSEVNDEAYDAYLRAWALMRDGTESSAEEALRLLERAQTIDPQMADAWGAEARAHWVLAIFANRPMRDQVEKVRVAASRALALDESQFYGHIGMGSYAQVRDKDWDTALRHYERAVELNPSEPIARFYLGNLHVLLGHWALGHEQAETIIKLSAPASYERSLASVMFTNTNNDARAISMFDQVNPDGFPGAPWQLARIYYRAGEIEKAIRQSELSNDWGVRTLALARGGQRQAALEQIAQINADGVYEAQGRVRMADVAAAHIWLNDLDAAFVWMERSFVDMDLWLLNVLREAYLNDRINDPRWVAFREDPRYWSFIDRLKLPALPPTHPGYADDRAWREQKGARETAIAPIERIAVLPLDDLSADPDQRYFADGMTEAITAELAKIKTLKVISRTSAQTYRDSPLRLPEIAAELNVQALTEGSVQRDGENVRITVQLIDARTDDHLLAESYDETLTNVLQLQSRVALEIADAIRAELTPDERQRIAASRDVDPAAYDLYLQAVDAMSDITPTGMFAVLTLFTRATDADPTYADAWAGVAISNILLGSYGVGSPGMFFERARDAAQRALDLDSSLGEAEVALALAEVYLDLDWGSARERFDRARILNPNSFFVVYFSSVFCMAAGDWAGAREHAEHVLSLNPNAPYPVTVAASVLMYTGRLEQGRQILEGEVAKNPSNIQAGLFLGWALVTDGDYDAAIAEFQPGTSP